MGEVPLMYIVHLSSTGSCSDRGIASNETAASPILHALIARQMRVAGHLVRRNRPRRARGESRSPRLGSRHEQLSAPDTNSVAAALGGPSMQKQHVPLV